MMNIYSKRGDKVVFTGQNGYDSDQQLARRYLTVGETYEVEEMELHNFSSSVKFVGYQPFFNTVMFESASDGVSSNED